MINLRHAQRRLIKELHSNLDYFIEDTDEMSEMFELENDIKLPSENKLNDKQKKVLRKVSRLNNFFLFLHGGVRSGKSYIALYIFIKKILQAPQKSLFLATGYNLLVLKTAIDQILDEFNLSEGIDYRYNAMYFRYTIDNKIIRLAGANNKRSHHNIRGITVTGWYANEITLQDKEVVMECLRRVSTKQTSFKVWDTNPSNIEHYIYKDFLLKAKQKKILEYQFTTYDNIKNLSKNYIEDQKKYLSDNDQKVFLDGEWLANIDMPFYNLSFSDRDIKDFIFGRQDRVAFLDPATGLGENASKSALSIIFHEQQIDGTHIFYFLGKLFRGSWVHNIAQMAHMLNYYKVTTFFYEDNLIGQGTMERDFEFTNIYRYNIKSVRNTTDKIARIMSIVSSVEKKQLLCLSCCDSDYSDSIRLSNVSTKKDLDAVDSLESAYRVLTT